MKTQDPMKHRFGDLGWHNRKKKRTGAIVIKDADRYADVIEKEIEYIEKYREDKQKYDT